jgi:hypothetical protein
VLEADEPCGHLDEVLVRAVPVEVQDAPESVPGERGAHIDEVARERVPADRDRAGEVHVVRRVAVRDGREEHDVVGSGLGGAAADLRSDPEIGVDRHVRSVILERRDGDETHPFLGCGTPNLGPAQTFVEQRSRPHGASILTLAGRAGLTAGLPIRPTSRILTCRPPWGRSY